MADSEHNLVDALADEFLERLQRGETPSISEYEQAHPECAGEIRRVFSSIQLVEQMASRRLSKRPSGVVATRPPERLGDYRYELCETLATTRFQGPRFVAAEHPTAEQHLRTALQISQELVREHPNIPEYAAAQIHAHHKLAHVLRGTGRSEEAEACLRSALDLQSSLVRQFPAVVSHRVWRAVVQESLADLLRERGELQEARSLVEDALATLNDCLRREWHPDFARLRSRNYEHLADILTRLGERELAEAARHQAQSPAFGEGPQTLPKREPGPGQNPKESGARR